MPTLQHAYAEARHTPVKVGGVSYSLFFVLYAAFAIYFYFSTVAPYLASADINATRILADSITYEAICVRESNFLDTTTLRDIGPCFALWLFDYNTGWLSLFNAVIIILSVIWTARVYERPWRLFLTLVLINPITFLSIFGPNKELFGLISFAMLAIFIRNRSLWALVFCLVTALFTRIPAAMIISAYCLLFLTALPSRGRINEGAASRYYIIIAGIFTLTTAIAAFYGSTLQFNFLGDFTIYQEISQATQISLSIENLSSYGLFLIVYTIRMVLSIYSGIIGFFYLIVLGKAEYYTVGVAGSSLLFVILSIFAIFGKLPDDLKGTPVKYNLIVFLTVFTSANCLSPLIQHRYFYPIYIFLLLFVTQREDHSNTQSYSVDSRSPAPSL